MLLQSETKDAIVSLEQVNNKFKQELHLFAEANKNHYKLYVDVRNELYPAFDRLTDLIAVAANKPVFIDIGDRDAKFCERLNNKQAAFVNQISHMTQLENQAMLNINKSTVEQKEIINQCNLARCDAVKTLEEMMILRHTTHAGYCQMAQEYRRVETSINKLMEMVPHCGLTDEVYKELYVIVELIRVLTAYIHM